MAIGYTLTFKVNGRKDHALTTEQIHDVGAELMDQVLILEPEDRTIVFNGVSTNGLEKTITIDAVVAEDELFGPLGTWMIKHTDAKLVNVEYGDNFELNGVSRLRLPEGECC